MASFCKFVRPEQARPGLITERDLDILHAVLRYRFCPASQLIRLVGGNEDVTHRRLRRLWETGLISRWAFPGIRCHSEFHYYLDNRQALDLLAEHRGLSIHPKMVEEVKYNRDKDYAGAAFRGQHMQLGFLSHALMISRLHFMLELACRKSGGAVRLLTWHQGAELSGHKVKLPSVRSQRSGERGQLWQETDESVRLPVEPDALFSLSFADRPGQPVHFCYEGDRGSMNSTDMLMKLRAYFWFIKKQQGHQQAFGVHPIRAVLIETTDEDRARTLMELVGHPLVSGPARRSGLFWFTVSPVFSGTPQEASSGSRQPLPYLTKPELVLSRIWALPDFSLHALTDAENS